MDSNEINIKRIIKSIKSRKELREDWKDLSIHPSYTKTEIPYHIKCRERYCRNKHLYEEQFQKEIRQQLTNQSTAYEEARLNRHLCITTLWPPLHNRTEIDYTQRYFFRLTRKQRQRLQYIMTTKII